MTKHIFCELDELQPNLEWKEVSRWLKFEEVVEHGGRWSKPHVATLALHSLFDLRKILSNSPIFFDLSGNDFFTIIDRVLLYSVQACLIKESDFESIKSVLLSKHLHQHEKDYKKQLDIGEKRPIPLVKSIVDFTKSKTSNSNLNSLNGSGIFKVNNNNNNNNQNISNNQQIIDRTSNSTIFELNDSDIKLNRLDSKPKDLATQYGSASSMSNTSRFDFKANQTFMRKIPEGTESANILVGELDYIDYQFATFIRLAKSCILGDLTEVAVPTKFLFILIGPKGNLQRYHEIGRSIGTIMSDEIFQEVAYNSKNKQQLLKGFDIFLDQVTVLPPSEWDPSIRLEPPKKTLKKEERLERIADTIKQTGSVESALSNKKSAEEEIHPHSLGPGLEFTGRICGGLIDDLKRKLPWYLSDFKDGFNFQCLSSILFMYFACLAPIITFGGLLGTATDNNMSAIESLLSGAICGILFSLFSGQPLSILGSTGPVLVFEKILNSFSKQYGIDYMGFRALTGLWMTLMLILIVVFDLSAFVKYITRFTEESFAALIAFIFINESILKLIEINKSYGFSNNPYNYLNKNCTKCINFNQTSFNLNKTECESLGFNFESTCNYVPDVFFFSIVLYLSTFLMAISFKLFRNSRFFPSFIRSKISDFGIVITILVNVLIDHFMGFNTPKLNVPLKFETTIVNRGWFINPIERVGDKWWIIILAILPAFLATILIFMDQHITAVIMNRKENKLKKSFGYHLDLLVIALTIAINSLLGIPWFVAATVLSINHVISLKKESESTVPGEKPKFLGVIEQRVTGVVIFSLIGSSVFLAKYLKKIPMPVLYGVFLYMGISSLNGMQFMHRLILPLMPEKHQPDYIFLRHVRTFKVHLFTFIQILCLAMLFLIKMNKTISITFPIMVLALVGVRKLMDYLFTQKELYYLDQLISENKSKKSKRKSTRKKSQNKKSIKQNNKNEDNEPKLKETLLTTNKNKLLQPPQIVIIDTDAEN